MAWTVGWAFVAHVWPYCVEGLLAQELTTGTALAARQGVAVAAVTAPANGLYALVFEATGLHAMGQRFAQGALLPVPDTIVRRARSVRESGRTYHRAKYGQVVLLALGGATLSV